MYSATAIPPSGVLPSLGGLGPTSSSQFSSSAQKPQSMNFSDSTNFSNNSPKLSPNTYYQTLNNYPQTLRFQQNSPDENKGNSPEEPEPPQESNDVVGTEIDAAQEKAGTGYTISFKKAGEEVGKNNIVPFTKVAQSLPVPINDSDKFSV